MKQTYQRLRQQEKETPERSLEETLHRLRLNFYQCYRPIRVLRESPKPDRLLVQWRLAERPSQEWRNHEHYKTAIQVLSASMGVSRTRARELLREYVTTPPETHQDRS